MTGDLLPVTSKLTGHWALVTDKLDVGCRKAEVIEERGGNRVEKKRLIVIGGVAAGTKAASKAKRENPHLEVFIFTREGDVSYAGCGLPYYIGGMMKERRELVVRAPHEFKLEQGIQIFVNHEVTQILPAEKKVLVTDSKKNQEKEYAYDYLVLATGASPIVPPIPGVDLGNIFTLRTVLDAENIRKLVEGGTVKEALVVGGGFIGLETAENLVRQGIKTTLVEMAPTIMPGFDQEMALFVTRNIAQCGLKIRTGTKVVGFTGNEEGNVQAARLPYEEIPAQLVVLATGIKPNVELAREAGIKIGPTGAIAVDPFQETSIPGIFAVGDCAENYHLLTGKPVWYPMGSTANKTGRIAGINIALDKKAEKFPGVLGTAIVKVFHMNGARTGLTVEEAKKAGFEPEMVWVPTHDKSHFYEDCADIITKLVVDKKTRKILGAQIVGDGVVDKPIDIYVTAISLGATVDDLSNLDLAYAPPFSMAMANTLVASHVMANKLAGKFSGLTYQELADKLKENPDTYLLDVRIEDEFKSVHLPGSDNIPLSYVRMEAEEMDPDQEIVVVCKLGKRAYLTYKILQELGFNNVKILEGGLEVYPYEKETGNKES
ncbi:MAG: putative NAD(FAD)-dependent dehydrogenase [Peptococcaceae bacterium]|nr:putative NAD(FAD)-dependent dehydrogenase [Peptococcaceae bacterium]